MVKEKEKRENESFLMDRYYKSGNSFRFPVPFDPPYEDKITGDFVIPVEAEIENDVECDIGKVPVWQGTAKRSDRIDTRQVEEFQFRRQLNDPAIQQEKLRLDCRESSLNVCTAGIGDGVG